MAQFMDRIQISPSVSCKGCEKQIVGDRTLLNQALQSIDSWDDLNFARVDEDPTMSMLEHRC